MGVMTTRLVRLFFTGCMGIGGWTLVGTREMAMVQQIGDPELTATASATEA